MKNIFLLGALLITSISNAQSVPNFLEISTKVIIKDLQTDYQFEVEDKNHIWLYGDKIEVTNASNKKTTIFTNLKFKKSNYFPDGIYDFYTTSDNTIIITIGMSWYKKLIFVDINLEDKSFTYLF